MHLRPKIRLQLTQVLFITLFWVLCGFFLALYKCVTYDTLSGHFIFSVPQGLPLGSFLAINLIGPFLGGLIGGSLLIMVLNESLRKKSYTYYLGVNIVVFFVFIFVLNTVVSYFFYYREAILSNDHSFQQAVRLLLLDPYAIRNIVTWMVIALITLQGLKIYEKYGPGTLLSMFLGRYHRPHEVERIFMFIDLSDSTTIAEELGHVRFFSLLHDFYIDITDPILNSRGEIYQYVGDEVIISWPLPKAIPYCVDCFFSIKEAIYKRESYYKKRYGVLPEFKSAVHKGSVVVGEIGVIKREIVYSGDILNTTARMMEQCKVQNQLLIISREVLDFMTDKFMAGYTLSPLGNMSLRGKKHMVELYGVSEMNNQEASLIFTNLEQDK